MLRKLIFRNFSTSKLQTLIEAKTWNDIKNFTNENEQVILDFNSGMPFTAKSGISYSKISSEDQDEAFDVLANCVSKREPMAVSLNITEDEFKRFTCQNLLVSSKYQELSICAKENNKIVGVFIATDWRKQVRTPPTSQEQIDFWKNKLEPLVGFLHRTNTVGKTQDGKIAHGVISGVVEEKLGQGIAKSALALRLGLSKTLGYDVFIAECGFGSSEAYKVYNRFLTFGSEMRYEDYTLNGKKVFGNLDGGYLFFYRELKG